MYLVLDHVILRCPDPAADLAMLEQAGLPLVVASRVSRAPCTADWWPPGSVAVEALPVGASPPDRVEGYGLGLRAPGTDQWQVASARTRSTHIGAERRDGRALWPAQTWSTVHVAGLLPEPFPCHSPTVHPVVESG
jgi:hypothetical protein